MMFWLGFFVGLGTASLAALFVGAVFCTARQLRDEDAMISAHHAEQREDR